MKAGQRPDADLACDTWFVPPVADLFYEPKMISRSRLSWPSPKIIPKRF